MIPNSDNSVAPYSNRSLSISPYDRAMTRFINKLRNAKIIRISNPGNMKLELSYIDLAAAAAELLIEVVSTFSSRSVSRILERTPGNSIVKIVWDEVELLGTSLKNIEFREFLMAIANLLMQLAKLGSSS